MNALWLSMFVVLCKSVINHSEPILSTVKDCSSGSSIGHIQTLSMNPSAPVAGQFAIVTVDYLLDSVVTNGEAKYTASFNGFPLTPTTQALCPDLEKTTPCPISPGLVHYEGSVQMGDGTTHGTVAATTTWYNQDGLEIVCWGFTVRI